MAKHPPPIDLPPVFNDKGQVKDASEWVREVAKIVAKRKKAAVKK